MLVQAPPTRNSATKTVMVASSGRYRSFIACLQPKSLGRAARALSDCSNSTIKTTTALTTRLYSGGTPLTRIDVVSVWMTSTAITVMPR